MALETFTSLPPNYGAKAKREFRVLRADFGDGYSQRAPDGLNSKKETWSLKWDYLDLTEYNTINNFLTARKGTEAFLWTPPYQTVARKFICSSFEASIPAYNLYEITAEFEEVYDL